MFKNINLFRSILAILILFIPLYPKFPLSEVQGTYVAIRLDDIVVAVSIFVWLIYQIYKKFPVFKLKITPFFIAYFISIVLSGITAFFIYQTEPRNILLLHIIRRFEYMSLFFIALSGIKSKLDLKYPYIFLVISTVLVSAYGYGQKYFKFPVISTMNSEFSKGQLLHMDVWTRINSTFAGHYDLAAYLSVALVIMGCVIILSKNIWTKLISVVIWLAAFQIFTFTASRISTFAFWGGICLTLFLLKKYLWIVPVSLLVIFSIVSSKDLNQRLLATIPAIKNQLFSKPIGMVNPGIVPTPIPSQTIIQPSVKPEKPEPTVIRHGPVDEYIPVDADVGVARSGEIRFNVEWPRAITAFKKNFLTGSGLGAITLATDNDYLRLLGESGAIGFLTFMAIFSYFFYKTIPIVFKKTRTGIDNLNIIFFGSLITMMANAVFIDVFEASKTAYLFWIMMGIYYQSLNLKDK